MPKLGLTMSEGRLAQWLVVRGAKVRAGEPLLVIETDKIANELECPSDGVLEEIVAAEGETVEVGALLARLRVEMRIVATPYARKVARQLGVNLRDVRGSGPRGRIKHVDVLAAASASATDGDDVATAHARRRQSAADDASDARSTGGAGPARTDATTPLESKAEREAGRIDQPRVDEAKSRRAPSGGREALIAARMTSAKQAPHFYLGAEVEVSRLFALLDEWRDDASPRLTVTHFLLAACARALAEHPNANRVWNDGVVPLETIDLGLAIDTADGLVSPVLRDLRGLDAFVIAERATDIVERARLRRLSPDELGGGALTISNAGMHDVTSMISIIPPGQSAILGVGRARELFRPDERGQPALKREIALWLSLDHRVHDGVGGAALLHAIRRHLEKPAQLLRSR